MERSPRRAHNETRDRLGEPKMNVAQRDPTNTKKIGELGDLCREMRGSAKGREHVVEYLFLFCFDTLS